MPTDHNIRQLIINKMTDAQYEQAVKSADELYLTPDTGGGGTDLPDQTGQSGKFLTTNGSTASWANVPAGTVTSVRVQATSPVQSSTSTAQSSTLNTTISLANGYGDTKNPYGTKTANYVLAGPSSGSAAAPTFRALTKADIPLASETAASGGTTTSLVTTGEKYIWNNKQDAGDYIEESDLEEIDINNLVPDQSGNSGKFLTTNGSSVSWGNISIPDIKTLNTTNTTAQTTSSSEAVAGSGTINLHKVSKTGSYNDLLNKPTIPQGTVTSVRVQAGTGLSSSTSTAQSTTLNTTISVASGYKLPTTTEWSNKQDALPSQSGNSGKFLTTNGSTMSWGTVEALPDQTGQSGKFLTTNGSTAAWAAVSVDIDNSTITENSSNQIQTVGVKDTRTNNTIKTWTGTKQQYDTLASSDWSTPTYISEFGNYWWGNGALAYGNGKFVDVSTDGYVTTSIDGITWAEAVQDENLEYGGWMYLAYGNNKFVTISESGHISTSIDGTTWTEPVEVSNLNHYWGNGKLAYGNDKFVVLDSDGYVSTSIDGTTWTATTQNSNLSSQSDWMSLTYGNGKFIALSAQGCVSTSIDGTTWTEPVENFNLQGYWWYGSLSYSNNKFLAIDAGGYVTTSTDGTIWTDPVFDNNLGSNIWKTTAYGNGKLIALTETDINVSIKEEPNENILYNVVNNGLYLGADQIANISQESDIDELTITKNSDNELQTVGVKDVRTNDTIKTWTGTKTQYNNLLPTNWTTPTLVQNLNSSHDVNIAYGNGKFIALSNDGYISTSTDGTTWTEFTENESLSREYGWGVVAYGNGKFVAVNSASYVSTSTDGTTWTTPTINIDLGYQFWDKLVYGNGKFVLLNTSGYISTSTDGVNWTQATPNSNLGDNNWYSLAYGNGKFVALGGHGYLSTSIDGINWTQATLNNDFYNIADTYESSWNTLIYDGTNFIAVNLPEGFASISSDGVNWSTAARDNFFSNSYLYINSAHSYNKYVLLMNDTDSYISTKTNDIHSDILYNVINDGLYLGTIPIADIGEDPLPSQSGNDGKYLTTNGTTVSWATVQAGPKFLTFQNMTASTWVSDNTYSEFSYKCVLTCTGVTSSDYAQVIFNPAQSVSGNYANVCLTDTDTVTIYSKVNTAISIPTITVIGSN